MAKGKQRERRRETRWRRIIGEHERSGLGVRAFCRAENLRESAFYFWRREIQSRQAEQEQRRVDEPTPAPLFVPVHVAEGGAAAGAIEILLPGGCRVHVAAPVDRQALADVLAALRSAAGVDVQEGEPC
jgi:transposase-like protein